MPTLLGRSKGFPTGTAAWDGKRLVREYMDEYEVQADNENQGPFTIIASLALPIGDPFFDDPFARLIRVGPAKRSEVSRLIWRVPLLYTTQFSDDDADDAVKKPDLRRQKKRWTFETMQVPFTQDAVVAAVPVANSADEPIEDYVDSVIPVLTVERFQATFDPDTILDYANHTNANTFFGAPAKSVLCAGIEADDDGTESAGNEVWEGLLYQRVRYVFKFKIPITEDNKGWVSRYVDAGTRYLSGGEYLPYMSDFDATIGSTQRILGNLDGAGGKLTVGDPLHILEFEKYARADFDLLNIV